MAKSPDQPGFAEGQAKYQAKYQATPELPQRWTLKVAPDGRFVIPAAARAAMELDDSGTVTAVLRDGVLTLVSPHTAIRQIQAMVKEHREKHGLTGSVVDELIAERREAAARGD
jgi:bifunctional DNA-binding transcriptional regulator/antitoxin component of YhaV-PrlF toxin-antitoxin module